MVIRFYCGCGKRLSAPDGTSGRHAKCPVCGARVLIPEAHPADENVPMAVPQKPAQEVIFEEPVPGEVAAPPRSSAPASLQAAGGLNLLQLAAKVGLIVMIATGVIACFATAADAIAGRVWGRLILAPIEALLLFLLIGLLGYVCAKGGVKRLAQLAGEVRDRTVPLALALGSLILALRFLWNAIEGMLAPESMLSLASSEPPIVNALSLLGMCVACVLVALIWRQPELIGVTVRDEVGPSRWAFLRAILGLVQLGGKVAFAASVILFGVSSAFACLALLVSVIVGLMRGAEVGIAFLIQSRLTTLGALGMAPLFGYLALLMAYGIAHTIRAWVAIEHNTRKPARR